MLAQAEVLTFGSDIEVTFYQACAAFLVDAVVAVAVSPATAAPPRERVWWRRPTLLGVHGLVLLVRGLFDGPAEPARAAGFAVNLWTGAGLVVVAVVFLVWARVRPLGIVAGEDLGAAPEV